MAAIFLLPAITITAGNADRAGSAGATELLINPWARSTGWAGANTACVKGLEAMFLNVAGITATKKTEMIFSRTSWLVGTDIKISSFGFTQHVGETGALGFSVMSMNFGKIPITTVDLPEGGIGTYSPQYVNIGLSYAKAFSDNISGGLNLKMISEALPDLNARGVAIDAGIQYVTGPYKNLHFGIALKNLGPKMRFNGDGLSFRTPLPANNPGGSKTYTVQNRSAGFDMPSLVNIGIGYDLYFSKDSAAMHKNRLTIASNFTSNSFEKDEFKLGVEYGFRSFLMVRVGYMYQQGITKEDDRTTVFTGPSAGVTVELPFGKEKKSSFGLDYSYRHTNPFQGVHSIGARINL